MSFPAGNCQRNFGKIQPFFLMIPATIGPHSRDLATTWNELNRQQLLDVAKVLLVGYERVATRLDALLAALLQIPRRDFRQLTPVHRINLRPLVHFLHGATDYPPLTAQLLGVFLIGRKRYYGPREAFRNLRFDEFIHADTHYLRYLQTGGEHYLDQLVAVLYRPERAGYDPEAVDYAGDRREDFNEHLVAARAKRLAALPDHYKHAVLLYYRGCRRLLEQRYPYVFTEGTQQKASTSGWVDALHELAGGVHNLDATAHQGLANVLREMNRVLRQHEERQEQLQNR
jgi:hypothetical protein